jgi:flagellar motor switch protein FliN/FliY
MSGILSQEEIDALLNSNKNSKTALSNDEIDTLGEVGNISMGSAATTLYSLLGRRVDITTPKVSISNMNKLAEEYPKPFVAIEVKYTTGIEGYNVLVLKHDDVMVITDLLMGGDGKNPDGELDEMRMSAISEIMNQMVGSSSTSLSSLINKVVNINPPRVFETDFTSKDLSSIDSDDVLKISFKMEIEDLVNSEIMQIMPLSFGKKLVSSLLNDVEEPEVKPEAIPATKPQNRPGIDNVREERSAEVQVKSQPQPEKKKVNVKPINLQSFDNYSEEKPLINENMNILMDVPLPITIELGKSKKLIKEILELNEGSVVVLDKFAGDLVDVVVNGKPIAKGEVVIIDDNYGVRITDIISPAHRLGKG